MPRLRPGTDSDSAGVIALIRRIYAEYEGCVLDVDREEPGLRAPASSYDRFWVLEEEEGSRVVGCSACTIGRDHVEVKKVYLDRDLRGRGWGRRLVEVVEETARGLGIRRIELWSDTRFTTAHRVYERLGYARLPESRELHDLSNSTEYHYRKEL
jgi:putative acetyltransferase